MLNSIPNDLIFEIFSRLPIKSIARSRCVSKLWRSTLCSQDFTDLFQTKSSARPRLLFVNQRPGKLEYHFYSSPQPHNLFDKSSLVLEADSYMTCPGDMLLNFYGYASGLVCFCHNKWTGNYSETLPVICNPSTGQHVVLPKLKTNKPSDSFLGFDPIGKQFKVLFIDIPYGEDERRTLTIGTVGEMSWRKIQSPLTYWPRSVPAPICIDGVLYYLVLTCRLFYDYEMVCFDVRSEKFKFVKAKIFNKLVNYKGKLGGITFNYNDGRDGFSITCLSMWVLEDVEKQEWSEYSYTLPQHKFDPVGCPVSVVGVIATGEIVCQWNMS